jgi:uncharacterized protein YndB with AHSA1/START domain
MDYEVTKTIDASPDHVWEILSDVERWPEWTASITSVEPLDAVDGAPFGSGSRARVKQPRFPAATWTVDEWVPGERFTWTARSGGVTTVADHELAPAPDGTTTATTRLRQTGPMAGPVALLFGGRARRYVDMEAAGLKHRSEAPAP